MIPREISKFVAILIGLTLSDSVRAESADDRLCETCESMRRSVVRVVSEGDRASGVIVTGVGHVLTVAHGVPAAGEEVSVRLPSGQRVAAEVLLRDSMSDVALLRLRKSERLHPATIAPSEFISSGRHVFAVGCPAREDDAAGSVVRVGTISAVDKTTIRSTAVVTVGDSGGALFDSSGHLVGIHRQIGLGRGTNVHTRIDVALAAIPQSFDVHKLLRRVSAAANPAGHDTEEVFDVSQELDSGRDVRLLLADDSQIPATVVDSDLVVAKASLVALKNVRGIVRDGIVLPIRDTRTAQAEDVIMVRPEEAMPAGRRPRETISTFQLVRSAADESVALVARTNWNEPSRTKKLGCRLVPTAGDGLRLTDVSANSAVADADLKVGDTLVRLNLTATHSLQDLRDGLLAFQPGDWITLTARRGNLELRNGGQLRHDTASMLYRAEFLDGRGGRLSERRSGFDGVIQHDLDLSPDQMGSPLFDREGRLIGVNIARRSRDAVLAIPIATIRRLRETYFHSATSLNSKSR